MAMPNPLGQPGVPHLDVHAWPATAAAAAGPAAVLASMACADCGRHIGNRDRHHQRSPRVFVCIWCHRRAIERHLTLAHHRLVMIRTYEQAHPGTGLWVQAISRHDVAHLVERSTQCALCGRTAPGGWSAPGDAAPLCPACEAVAFGIFQAAGWS
jgi:hypothetical protein